jgi:NAD(P)-dependent dehydrogenase (short-subunit alcohol dehydrogenase family)
LADAKNVDQVMRAHGRIDVLVNNAAVTSYFAPELLPEENWRREVDVVLAAASSGRKVSPMPDPAAPGRNRQPGSGAALAAVRCAPA